MSKIPLGMETYERRRGDEPDIRFVNRFLEADPTDQIGGVAALRRPGLNNRINVGDGPIRRVFWQSGFFKDALFIISDHELYRMTNTTTEGDKLTLCTGFVYGTSTPSVAVRDDYIFIADGTLLQYSNGNNIMTQILTPDEVIISSIAVVRSYVVCLVQNSDRFYWIDPGALVIDPLDFATAESQPDVGVEVQAFGDQFWIFGRETTEPWFFTGDALAPVAPVQGRPFDRGAWGGTAVKVNDEIILVGQDGRVYSVRGGADPISTPGVEERIAKAMKIQVGDL